MDVCIFYFSGTGNTWWASEKLTDELRNKGRSAESYSIELLDNEKIQELIENSGTIVFGYPIYGSCMPELMKIFIDGLPKTSKEKEAGIFCTQMEFSGDGAWYYHKNLERKGFKIMWTFHFKLPNNICFKISPYPYTDDKFKIQKKFKKCEDRIKTAADKIATGIPFYKGRGFGSLLLGLTQRPAFKTMVKRPFKSPYKSDMEKCTKCMRCVQICPEGNIKLSEGEITFGTECILCMRCYNFCPQMAIKVYGLSHNEKKEPYQGPEGFEPALITPNKNLSDYIE